MFHSGHHEALKEDLVIYRNKIWAFNIYANVEVDLSDSWVVTALSIMHVNTEVSSV